MIIRRVALTILLAGILSGAVLVGVVSAQQTPPTQQAPPTQQSAPGGSRTPLPTDRRTSVPQSNPSLTDAERYLALLDCYKPTKPLGFDPHCEATVALTNFISRLDQFGPTNPFPSCDLGMVGAINDINLKVNTAIEYHKFSDRIFDDPRFDQRKIDPRDKSRWMTENDLAIYRIVEILMPYSARPGSSSFGFTPVLYHRDVVRHAADVLELNNKLSAWGLDVAFLTTARGYAIYQFVINCVSAQDLRQTTAAMAARAYAVRTAAESESFFSQEILNLNNDRVPRPALRRWLVENDLIEGGGRKGGGFPRQIYLGSSHGFEYYSRRLSPEFECSRGLVRNFYGTLREVRERIGNLDVITKFEPVGVESQCEYEINQDRRPAINTLLTLRTLPYVPLGGGVKDDYEQLLKGIADAITGHIRNIIDQKDFEACELGLLLNQEERCKQLAASFGRQRQATIASDLSEEKKQIVAELTALQSMALVIRNILSIRPRPEQLRYRR
jgi:hypothetical protein